MRAAVVLETDPVAERPGRVPDAVVALPDRDKCQPISSRVANAAIRLIEPVCKATLIPNSADPGASVETITSEMSSRWMQTLG